jgi:hypothetical protein
MRNLIGIKEYAYAHGFKVFYLTVNDIQFGKVMFSRSEAEAAEAAVWRGEDPWKGQ